MRRAGFVVLIFLSVACSSSSEPKPDPSKGARYTITCRNEMQDCYDRAASLCPQGYMMVNRVRGVKAGSDTDYTTIIRCKDKVVF